MLNFSVYLEPSFITNLLMIELYQWTLEPNYLIQGFVYSAVLFMQYVHIHQKMFLHVSKKNWSTSKYTLDKTKRINMAFNHNLQHSSM
jgi:hypothetical protein